MMMKQLNSKVTITDMNGNVIVNTNAAVIEFKETNHTEDYLQTFLKQRKQKRNRTTNIKW